MPTSPSLTNTPITTSLLLLTTTLSITPTLLDLKHLLPIRPHPHLYPYLQLSRLLTYQLAYLNSSELLFSCLLLYTLRSLERIYGSRKYLSFVLVVYMLNVVIVPVIVGVMSLGTGGRWNYVPPGLTGVVLAGVACWREEVPVVYKWRVGMGGGSGSGITVSNKATTYVMALQLALSQFPYGLVPAGVGWVVGMAWRAELVPGGMGRWRVPRWVVGEGGKERVERERFEGLRRRLEEEEEGSGRDGMRRVVEEGGRRGIGAQVRDYFRGGS